MESDADAYCVVGDARRQSFFFAQVNERQLLDEITLHDEAGLRQKLDQLHHGLPVYSMEMLPQFEKVTMQRPSAMVLARIVRDGVVAPQKMPLEPIYLRKPYITVPKTAAILTAK